MFDELRRRRVLERDRHARGFHVAHFGVERRMRPGRRVGLPSSSFPVTIPVVLSTSAVETCCALTFWRNCDQPIDCAGGLRQKRRDRQEHDQEHDDRDQDELPAPIPCRGRGAWPGSRVLAAGPGVPSLRAATTGHAGPEPGRVVVRPLPGSLLHGTRRVPFYQAPGREYPPVGGRGRR